MKNWLRLGQTSGRQITSHTSQNWVLGFIMPDKNLQNFLMCALALMEKVVSFYLGGGWKHGEGLREISREVRIGKGVRKDGNDRIDTSWFTS